MQLVTGVVDSTQGFLSPDALNAESGCQSSALTPSPPPPSLAGGAAAWAATVRRVWPHMLSIFLAYLVTLSLFPGLESEVRSCRLGSWMPVILMAIFNGSDFIGKVTGDRGPGYRRH